MRKIMQREELTYQQVADYAEVSTQAVYKWLFKGDISDIKARELSEKIGFDWLWLKYGINRVPLDTFHDMVMASTKGMMLVRWTDMEIIAFGQDQQQQIDYQHDDILGRNCLDFMVGFPEEYLRPVQKIIYALNGMIEHSYRGIFQDKYSTKAIEISCKGITTDGEGHTYEVSQVEVVEPNGTENSLRSLKFHKKNPFRMPEPEIELLAGRYHQFPWLADFLRD